MGIMPLKKLYYRQSQLRQLMLLGHEKCCLHQKNDFFFYFSK